MTEIVRRMTWGRRRPLDADALLTREWLVTNGLGGSASGTVAGVATRRFHGLLVAALPAPLGRIVMLNHLGEQLRLPDGRLIELGGSEDAEGGHLYDVVDGERGDDPACRPNQLFAISLPHPILDQARWETVLRVVQERLLTPVGLRSLTPGHPDYKSRYFGDLRARNAAYHQGTVWGWLAGPFVDAWLKVYPHDLASARRALAGFDEHLGEACLGTLSEIFDAEAPYTPRGCVAQAWSVAEVLRCLVKTAEGTSPDRRRDQRGANAGDRAAVQAGDRDALRVS